ncbi:MAG: hypothetical protein AAF385_09155 [Pseudomonadota bacterium]
MNKLQEHMLFCCYACLLVLASVFANPVIAQEAPTDTEETAAEQSDVEDQDETVDDVEPGVSSEALSDGVVRRATNTGVYDELDLQSTRVTGNQELPKVLYIVPWKQADLGDLVGRPVNSLLDEALEPVDRDVFRRQTKYYSDLYEERSDAPSDEQ